MGASARQQLQTFMQQIERCNPGEPEFHQAVHEVAADIIPILAGKPEYRELRVLERLAEPDRTLSFRVVWEDDNGNIQINRGFRVQQSNAIGPYKGGTRFEPDLTQGIVKFLAFEQVFKNSLTGLMLGGGKGGANFNPRGRSEREVMRFCQAFMTELYRHIGPDTDVPAGDIGVGEREVGYLFGQYKRLTNRFEGAITGKSLASGGSRLRTEATGHGVVYMMAHMLAHRGESLEGKRCLVSGAGNVALHCADKLLQQGAKVLTLSDSGGLIHARDGLGREQFEGICRIKTQAEGRLAAAAEELDLDYHEGKAPWGLEAELAFPCAIQNEIDADAARHLAKNGIQAIAEGANMPTTPGAIAVLREAGGVLHAPSKAANAGGVAVSGLEMSQNSSRLSWSADEVDRQLQEIMSSIHARCVEHGETAAGRIDYFRGANIAGFCKVADALMAYGIS